MRMPNGDKAVITDDKLLGYLLNDAHPTNPGHALLFRALLGISTSNVEVLRQALLRAAATGEAMPGTPSEFGEKYEIRFEMTGPRGSFTILSVWIVERGASNPRLVTAYVD
jgi:hypothetical protein